MIRNSIFRGNTYISSPEELIISLGMDFEVEDSTYVEKYSLYDNLGNCLILYIGTVDYTFSILLFSGGVSVFSFHGKNLCMFKTRDEKILISYECNDLNHNIIINTNPNICIHVNEII